MNKMNFPSYFECQKAMNKLKSITPKEYKKKFSKEELDKTLHEQQEFSSFLSSILESILVQYGMTLMSHSRQQEDISYNSNQI